jgi:hypothetical protein
VGRGQNSIKNRTEQYSGEGTQYNKEQYSTVGRGHNTIKNSTVQWGGDTIQ